MNLTTNQSSKLTVIIGHRGTGKSSFLERYASYFPAMGPFLDLDLEIEKQQGHTVSNIFLSRGEKCFRQLESEIFKKLSLVGGVIAVGAGFPVQQIPPEALVIWIRRESDRQGRIFTDRPRLLQDVDPLVEYEIKRKQREPLFLARADLIHTVPEGIEVSEGVRALEMKLFTAQIENGGGVRTVFPNELRRKVLAVPGIFELRDDLLSPEEMASFLDTRPQSQCLYAFRSEPPSSQLKEEKIISRCVWVDEPAERKLESAALDLKQRILSSHQNEIQQGIAELTPQPGFHLKLSPLILRWDDLLIGHKWQQEDPSRRSFLPRSLEGRWKWYRLYQKGRQELNFWYEAEASASDQPSLMQWLMQPEKAHSFAAVLGSPVLQSLSPMMHFDFFKRRDCCFFAIDIKEKEWDEALPILQLLGLRAAAVTSPLKKSAHRFCQKRTAVAEDLQAVNTMAWESKSQVWIGTNTDFSGFVQSLKGKELPSPIVIWGGSGVLSMLKRALPEASSYSARQGIVKKGNREIHSPLTLIWAAPSRPEICFPPKEWLPKVVLDLNYAENSLGRKYAAQVKVPYQSGRDFFCSQALEQQEFWKSFTEIGLSADNS